MSNIGWCDAWLDFSTDASSGSKVIWSEQIFFCAAFCWELCSHPLVPADGGEVMSLSNVRSFAFCFQATWPICLKVKAEDFIQESLCSHSTILLFRFHYFTQVAMSSQFVYFGILVLVSAGLALVTVTGPHKVLCSLPACLVFCDLPLFL